MDTRCKRVDDAPIIFKMVQTFLSGEYEYALAAWDNQVIQA